MGLLTIQAPATRIVFRNQKVVWLKISEAGQRAARDACEALRQWILHGCPHDKDDAKATENASIVRNKQPDGYYDLSLEERASAQQMWPTSFDGGWGHVRNAPSCLTCLTGPCAFGTYPRPPVLCWLNVQKVQDITREFVDKKGVTKTTTYQNGTGNFTFPSASASNTMEAAGGMEMLAKHDYWVLDYLENNNIRLHFCTDMDVKMNTLVEASPVIAKHYEGLYHFIKALLKKF